MNIRSGQSGEFGVMYSDGLHTVSCRSLNGDTEYLVTKNVRLHPILYRMPFIRVMEKLRLMFRNSHPHVQFLKGENTDKKIMPFYLRFFLFLLVVSPVYFGLIWIVMQLTKNFPFFWMELAVEAIFMYGLFMLVASRAMTHKNKMYHSAEHQVVNALREHGSETDLHLIKKASRFHASCGTGAAFSVAVGVFITLLVIYLFFPPSSFVMYATLNIVLFPIGVSVGLELFSFIPFLYRRSGIILLVYPSFLLQRFTTRPASENELTIAWLAAQKLLDQTRS